MGVPKFFRWMSERYPRINQRFGSMPEQEIYQRHFEHEQQQQEQLNEDDETQVLSPPEPFEEPDRMALLTRSPAIDRLYLDMNGIIHGCSHNNNDGGGVDDDSNETFDTTSRISNEEIYRNVCYYLDRVIEEMVQPKQVVYMAIDGVAPRAKLNQQRSRRYRNGKEGEIEETIYDAHKARMRREEQEDLDDEDDDGDGNPSHRSNKKKKKSKRKKRRREDKIGQENDTVFMSEDSLSFGEKVGGDAESDDDEAAKGVLQEDNENDAEDDASIKEIEPGRFKGKFMTEFQVSEDGGEDKFHSNAITPGTPFFQEFTKHLEHYCQHKMNTDPKWKELTIIFSGPNVPGEGEHKIMQFIREQKARPDYDPNLRHCIMGQDGDLIMLGLATHEPNLVLLRERVIFNMTKKKLMDKMSDNSLGDYLHNPHFEYLHLGVLRDYIAYEFGTSNVFASSPYDLERTIDDFVFMTFFVGNDFLPHMPALDIADNAFDSMFSAYKKCRDEWLEHDPDGSPYLTDSGDISSGQKLEHFLQTLGSHEPSYYNRKKQAANSENERMRKESKRFGYGTTVPSEAILQSKEESDRAAYRTMLAKQPSTPVTNQVEPGKNGFAPVMTGFTPSDEDEESEEIVSRMGNLLQNSIQSVTGGSDTTEAAPSVNDQDLKGRYYYDKFQLTPFDAEKHLALRKSYIEGLAWNLKYYYEGCVSWEWYYPYHYGPMLSDLVNLDELLQDISFDGKLGEPLKPFEQLLGCMPPSQSYHLPKAYQSLMTDPNSPIIDFYPNQFLIDMNGKRWPWEAVALLPFIDSERLIKAAGSIDYDQLSDEDKARNEAGNTIVMKYDPAYQGGEIKQALNENGPPYFGAIEQCRVTRTIFEDSEWHSNLDTKPILRPQLSEGVRFPLPGFGSLRDAPVRRLWRHRMGLNIFGTRSRYKTASLVINNDVTDLVSDQDTGTSLIGTSVYVNYPYFTEALVTAASDEEGSTRGKKQPKKWTTQEAQAWKIQRDGVVRLCRSGEGVTGSGGLVISNDQSVTLSVRPLEKIVEVDGEQFKQYATFEIEVPLASTYWIPSNVDPELESLPKLLEKDAYTLAQKKLFVPDPSKKAHRKLLPSKGKKVSPSFLSLGLPKESEMEEDEDTYSQVDDDIEIIYDSSEDEAVSGENTHTMGGALSSQVPVRTSTKPSARSMSTLAYTCTGDVSGQQSSTWYVLDQSTLAAARGRPISSFPSSLPRPGGMCQMPYSGHSGMRRSYTSASQSLPKSKAFIPRGNGRTRLIAAGTMAAAFLFGSTSASHSNAATLPEFRDGSLASLMNLDAGTNAPMTASWDRHDLFGIRGGDGASQSTYLPSIPTAALEFDHGTTTVSFTFDGGIIAAVDSRASQGNFVGSKTVEKVLPINSHILGTMAGGAADCAFWIRKIKSEALHHELAENGRRMSVARASRLLSNALYQNRGLGLSIGTMVMGFDDDGDLSNDVRSLPRIFYVDNTGTRIEGDLFAVGSGSTFALGILDTERRADMTRDQAVALGIKAIRHATFRDAFSGGFINVYVLTQDDGWRKVFSEDLAKNQGAGTASTKDDVGNH